MPVIYALSHILARLESHVLKHASIRAPPLFVAIQGPQGSGKTYLANELRQLLSAPPHNLSITVLSIDDLYLPRSGLQNVAARHPFNKLLQGRGLPGTHDIALGTQLLERLKRINNFGHEVEVAPLELPHFDKSLHGGQGDRLPHGALVKAPVDVVLFEGWFVGFGPISPDKLNERYENLIIPDLEGLLEIRSFSKEEIAEINENLKDYVDWWSYFDTFIQLTPPASHPYSFIYSWRLQQEHFMKATNGGKGMTDEQVKLFIDRYIPGYIFFADGVSEGYTTQNGDNRYPTWRGNGIRITIDLSRNVTNVENF